MAKYLNAGFPYASAHRPTSQAHNSARPIGSRARLAEALAGRAAAFQESGAIRVESIFFVGSI